MSARTLVFRLVRDGEVIAEADHRDGFAKMRRKGDVVKSAFVDSGAHRRGLPVELNQGKLA